MTFDFLHAFHRIGVFAGRILPVAALLLMADTSLAEWTAVPDIRLTAETDDNPRLRPAGQEQDASRITLDGRLNLENLGDRGVLYLQPRIRSSSYSEPENEVLEDEELFLRTFGRYDWQAASVGYSAYMSQQNIRNAEFRSSDPVDPDNPDPVDPGTGLGDFVDGDRESALINPYIEFHVSDRNSFLAEFSHWEVTYSGPAAVDRSNYDSDTVSLGIIRRVAEITQVTARVFVSEFNSARNNNVTETVGVQGDFVQPLGASWTMNVTAGVQRNDFTYEQGEEFVELIENADTNLTLTFGFRRRGDLTRFNFDIGRGIYPSGAGFISEVSQVRFWVDRRLTERLTGRVSTRYERFKVLDQLSTISDRDYVRVDLGINWAMTPRWLVTAGVQLTDQEYENLPNRTADSTSVFLGVNYRGLAR